MPLLRRPTLLATVFTLSCAATAQAADFNFVSALNQGEFRAFSEDIAAASSYKPMIPSEGLGITGIDFGVSAGVTEVAHRDVLRKAAGGGSVPKALPVAGLRLVKGLPFDIDVGVTALSLPGTNVRALGGEARWAVLGGSTLVPAVALRVATMRLTGVDQLKMTNSSIDISVSKGFALFTPYAGVGYVDVRSRAPGTALQRENFGMGKVFAGLNIAFVPFALLAEADRTGDATSYGLKLAIRW